MFRHMCTIFRSCFSYNYSLINLQQIYPRTWKPSGPTAEIRLNMSCSRTINYSLKFRNLKLKLIQVNLPKFNVVNIYSTYPQANYSQTMFLFSGNLKLLFNITTWISLSLTGVTWYDDWYLTRLYELKSFNVNWMKCYTRWTIKDAKESDNHLLESLAHITK